MAGRYTTGGKRGVGMTRKYGCMPPMPTATEQQRQQLHNALLWNQQQAAALANAQAQQHMDLARIQAMQSASAQIAWLYQAGLGGIANLGALGLSRPGGIIPIAAHTAMSMTTTGAMRYATTAASYYSDFTGSGVSRYGAEPAPCVTQKTFLVRDAEPAEQPKPKVEAQPNRPPDRPSEGTPLTLKNSPLFAQSRWAGMHWRFDSPFAWVRPWLDRWIIRAHRSLT